MKEETETAGRGDAVASGEQEWKCLYSPKPFDAVGNAAYLGPRTDSLVAMAGHGITFQERPPVEAALEWYGLGDGPKGEPVHFIGELDGYFRESITVFAVHDGEELQSIEQITLPLDQIWFAAISAERVLVRVPVVFVTIFGLAAFILSPEELAEAERRVREYNTTFLPPSSDKPVETFGGIRI